MKQKRCLIAMSGGVDSSVAAALMQEAGYTCVGLTMLLQDAAPANFTDAEDAAHICKQLGMEHLTLDLRSEFSTQVIGPFVHAYCEGHTPNPCIACNKYLKFAALQAWAEEQGFDCLATGHYARIQEGMLLKARNASKDQSYVLYTLTPEQLAFIRFPLGELSKQEVRELAKGLGLNTAEREESQDICFIPEGNYAAFIEAEHEHYQAALPCPGAIHSLTGEKLGTHRGVHHFTIGQRKGLGIAHSEPLYVVDIDAARAQVTVGSREDAGKDTALLNEVNLLAPQLLFGDDASLACDFGDRVSAEDASANSTSGNRDSLDAAFVNSISGDTVATDATPDGKVFTVKHRYRGKEHHAKVFIEKGNTSKIVFLEKQRDLTTGQALVIYDGDRVVGGGTIAATEQSS